MSDAKEERIDIDLLRMRLEAGARRYAALAAEHAEVVRRVQRVLELLDPQSLLVRAFQQTSGNGDGLIVSLDLLIDRLESVANPQALLVRPGEGGSESSGEGGGMVVRAVATTDRVPDGDAHLTDVQRQFIRLVGEGHLVLVEIAEQMGIPRPRVHEIASQLGPFLVTADVEIPASPTARRAGIAGRNRVVRLSPAGVNLWRQLFGKEPVDVWGDLEGRYKSIPAAFFIRGVADLIRGLNNLEVEERIFHFLVVDPAVASDEEIAEIGGRREYISPAGDAVAQPDLLVRMQPVKGGADALAVVEVEFGNYSTERLRDKWRRALLCYPPLTLYVVAPNQVVRDRLFREMEETRRQMLASGHIFDRWARYIFYTVDEIARNGLLSPNQIVRQEMARKQGEAGIFLPKYFFQKPVRGADDE